MSDLDRAAFDEFVRARTPALARTAYLLTGDAHFAEDLVQTALFKAARAWHRIDGDPEPYVRRVLYTQNVSWWRLKKLRETALGSYDGPAPTADNDLRLTLEAAPAQTGQAQDDGVGPAVEIADWTDVADSREIIDVDYGVYLVTLAYDLIGPERPTVTRPAPDWPWSQELKTTVLVGGAAGAVLLLL